MAKGLKTARAARGWSQDRLVYEMRRVAEQRLLDIASAASLKTYISEWENGRRVMSDQYASLLRPLLGVTDDELRCTGSAPEPHTDGYADLLNRMTRRAVSVSPWSRRSWPRLSYSGPWIARWARPAWSTR